MKKEEKKVTEMIKSFEDAQKATARPNVPDFSNVPEDLRDYFIALYKMAIITEALNGDWKADYNDSNQAKYYPWFYMSSAGFVFLDTGCDCSNAYASSASRLCFKTREIAKYAGEQFLPIWIDIITK